jgi:drug/metabolite transporter (DMT)-like permease
VNLRDVPPLLVDDAVALVFGYLAAVLSALLFKKPGDRARFVRQHWVDLVGLTLAAIFGSAVLTFFIVALVVLVMRGVIGVQLPNAEVWPIACATYVIVFVGSISYYAWSTAKDDVA